MKFATFGRIAVIALLIAAPLGVASAADMAVKAPKVPPPPPFDWNGFYVGVYGGAAWMDQANTPDPCNPLLPIACIPGVNGNFVSSAFPFATNSVYDMNASFNGGVRVGYNWQPTPYTLLGLENDFGYLHLKGSDVMNLPGFPFGSEVATTKLGDWYDAYTARVGAVDGHAMLYLKGGGVTARYSTGVVFTPTPGIPGPVTLNTTTTKDLSGWAAGGGIEYGIDMHWSVRAEYLVLGLARNVTSCGTAFSSGVALPGSFCTVTHTPDVQTITVGLNYRFR